ncbi:hypothetical protein D9619_012454 [Psilocybe cf. subviscida]|uniref:Uncharacterized protein n=1 Tax=Psilocybe cf. subviscida TaxID=2480587 RepID=A0A8H5ER69_9AGAR|nr:hypothetical protein D9619_012454 [Psilocybe cf. subviscida]
MLQIKNTFRKPETSSEMVTLHAAEKHDLHDRTHPPHCLFFVSALNVGVRTSLQTIDYDADSKHGTYSRKRRVLELRVGGSIEKMYIVLSSLFNSPLDTPPTFVVYISPRTSMSLSHAPIYTSIHPSAPDSPPPPPVGHAPNLAAEPDFHYLTRRGSLPLVLSPRT